MEKIGRKPFLQSRLVRKKKKNASEIFLRAFFSRYFEWILVFFFVGLMGACSLFSWFVAESSWNLDHFFRKNIVLPKENICVYVEGSVRKEGVFWVEKGCLIKKVIERACPKREAVFWKKLYRKRLLTEPASIFIPCREDFFPSWDNTLWMENWQ